MRLAGWVKLLSDIRSIQRSVTEIEDKVIQEMRRQVEAQESETKRAEMFESLRSRTYQGPPTGGLGTLSTPTNGNT